MAAVLFYHVVGDITIGKPNMREFPYSASVRDALKALKLTNHVELAVWKMPRRHSDGEGGPENVEEIQHRFVGILSFMDIMTFLASPHSLQNLEWALESPVSDILCVNPELVQLVDPATSLYDALQIIQKGVRILLVPLNSRRQKLSTHFSVIYHGRWIVPPPAQSRALLLKQQQDHCCLTVEDVVRFLTGCLGALAPIPLMSADSLGIINKDFLTLKTVAQAVEATRLFTKCCTGGRSTAAIAVVKELESRDDTTVTCGFRLFGEISSFSFAGSDENMIVAFATMSAAEFIFYSNYYLAASFLSEPRPSLPLDPLEERAPQPLNTFTVEAGEEKPNADAIRAVNRDDITEVPVLASTAGVPEELKVDGVWSFGECKELSSTAATGCQSLDLKRVGSGSPTMRRNMSRTDWSTGLNKLITCRPWNSLAAVLAQVLSNGANHVWVTGEDGSMLGIITYVEIVTALCKKPGPESSSSF